MLDDIQNKDAQLKILDLGTGTGAIALALAAELANSQVVAVDLYQQSLDVAKKMPKQTISLTLNLSKVVGIQISILINLIL